MTKGTQSAFAFLAIPSQNCFPTDSIAESFRLAKKNNSAPQWLDSYAVCHVRSLDRHSAIFETASLEIPPCIGRETDYKALRARREDSALNFRNNFPRNRADMEDDNLLSNKTLNRTRRLIV